MKRAVFTPEEQELLRQNPYTAKVTDCQIHFTAEFKQKFWEADCAGMKPTEIVRSLGYDPALIGQRRISMMAYHIRDQAKAGEEFHTGRRPARKRPAEPETLEDTVKDLKTRLEFAEKQIDFLKKTMSIRAGARQVSS